MEEERINISISNYLDSLALTNDTAVTSHDA